MKSRIRAEVGSIKMPLQSSLRSRIDIGRNLLLTGAVALALCGATDALAKGGTAKPPAQNLASPFFTPVLPTPVLAATHAANLHGLDVTGFMKNATVSASNATCPGTINPNLLGGTAVVNGVTITVPCNLIVQMPANTLTWADFVNGGATDTLEMHVVGNMVPDAAGNPQNIAALIYVSQQSVNLGSGFITKIDYTTGNIEVDDGTGTRTNTILQINDPLGRFGRAQSPDSRFSVDDQNPTIHAATGYPMCVPRTRVDNNIDDPRCPQINRPKANVSCRNFAIAGVAAPVSGELAPPVFGQVYCSAYVMPPVTAFGAIAGRLPTEPDAREMVPFEVGDFIVYSGTKMVDPVGNEFMSVYNIEANVGAFTQPGSQPSYLAIGGFGVGTADPIAVGINGAGQETTNRIFLEASTTDVKTPVDIYYVDVDAAGRQHNRWATPWEMTGECNPAAVGGLPVACLGATGGITTQNLGPQATRARIRAVKSPVGLLNQPTRTVRVVARSLCAPTQTVILGGINTTAQDTCINGQPKLANGLLAGQYTAPVFEYIFPENVKAGQPVVPADLWHLPFIVFGDDAAGGVGPLEPAPW